MTVSLSRALRSGVAVAGLAAMGATFSGGTALAADQENHFRPDASDSPDDGHTEGFADGDPLPGLDADYLDFGLPTRSPSTSVPADNDDDGPSVPDFRGVGHHDHHGADDPYDYDLYSPAEKYDENVR